MKRSSWSWHHVVSATVFALVVSTVAQHFLGADQLNREAVLLAPSVKPGTTLHQRLRQQAALAGVPMRWLARDPAAERAVLNPSATHRGTLRQTLTATIGEERLAANAQHLPIPEIEACVQPHRVIVRAVDLNLPC